MSRPFFIDKGLSDDVGKIFSHFEQCKEEGTNPERR